MNVRGLTGPALACACAFATAGHAFPPIDVDSTPLLRVAATAPVSGRRVRINDKMMMLAPGATIRDMNNRMVLPNTIRNPKKIRYTVDQYGQVKRIWISPTGGSVDRDRPAEVAEPNN